MERTRLMDYGYYGIEDEELNAKEEKGAKAQRKKIIDHLQHDPLRLSSVLGQNMRQFVLYAFFFFSLRLRAFFFLCV